MLLHQMNCNNNSNFFNYIDLIIKSKPGKTIPLAIIQPQRDTRNSTSSTTSITETDSTCSNSSDSMKTNTIYNRMRTFQVM